MPTFEEIFPDCPEFTQDEFTQAQAALDVASTELADAQAILNKLRSELAKLTASLSAPIAAPDPGEAFVNALLGGKDAVNAAKAAADTQTAILDTDEKTQSIIKALAAEINRQEVKHAALTRRRDQAGQVVNAFVAQEIYGDMIKPAAKMLIIGMKQLHSLELEYGGINADMILERFKVTNPLSGESAEIDTPWEADE